MSVGQSVGRSVGTILFNLSIDLSFETISQMLFDHQIRHSCGGRNPEIAESQASSCLLLLP